MSQADRQRDARRAGRVALSPILVAAAAAGGALVAVTFGDVRSPLVAFTREAFAGQADLSSLMATFWRATAPVLLAALVAAVAVGLLQTRALFTLGAFSRRQPRPSAWLRTLAGLGAALIVAGALKTLLVELAHTSTIGQVTDAVVITLGRVLPRVLLLLLGVGLVELGRARQLLSRSLEQTRAEQRAESRREHGDPQMRAESRRRQRS